MVSYKDGLKNLLSSDRFTSRATPFRLEMMARIRERARRGEAIEPQGRFPAIFRQFFLFSDVADRERRGRMYFESLRFRFFHLGAVRPWPEHLRFEQWDGWPGLRKGMKGVRYRSGMEKRKRSERP